MARRRRFTNYDDDTNDDDGDTLTAAAPPAPRIYARWTAVVARDDLVVDDGFRSIGRFEWLDGPMTLNKDHGQTMADVIGHVSRYEKINGVVFAEGVTYDTMQGREATSYMVSGAYRGFSAEPFSTQDVTVEVDDEGMVTSFHTEVYTIGAMSTVSIPAWPDTGLLSITLAEGDESEPLPELAAMSASGASDEITGGAEGAEIDVEERDWSGFGGLIASSGALDNYPTTSFNVPECPVPMPLTVFDDLSYCGHLAIYGTCHTGYTDRCVTPPVSHSHYTPATQSSVMTEHGMLRVGRLSIGSGHAPRGLTPHATKDFYDLESSGVGFHSVTDGQLGIWLSGHLNLRSTEDDWNRAAASPVSGDWRKMRAQRGAKRQLELIAVLSVSNPGFPIPNPEMRIENDEQISLVAAGAKEMALIDPRDGIAWASEFGKPTAVTEASKLRRIAVNDRIAESVGMPTTGSLHADTIEAINSRVFPTESDRVVRVSR